LFSGRNFWDPPGPKLTPDGRLSLKNSSFTLQLKGETNEMHVAVSNEESDSETHFGLGLEMRLDDRKGLRCKTSLIHVKCPLLHAPTVAVLGAGSEPNGTLLELRLSVDWPL